MQDKKKQELKKALKNSHVCKSKHSLFIVQYEYDGFVSTITTFN